MSAFAFTLLAVAMLFSLGGAIFSITLLWNAPVKKGKQSKALPKISKQSRCLIWIENINLAVTMALIIASLVLVHALAKFDFSLVYVASYTDRVLPLFYRLTAFWAGQAGSMLFWALAVALCGAAFQCTASYHSLSIETRLWYWIFYLSLMSFLGLLLITWNNPFLIGHPIPADGNGLNPLLQNPGMIFHPPLLLLGYGGFVIPGCLALAQTMSTDANEEKSWSVVSRSFMMTGWAFLTAGIILGGWWAYMELGWGGYWAWDPVENASLIPWLVATASLHTLIIQNRRNKLHGTNVFLMALTTISAFFATYLVRSGIVQSVHAFGEGNLGGILLAFIAFSTIVSLWIARLARRQDAKPLSGLDSREGFVILTAWLLLALALIILIATLWPVFTAFWHEVRQSSGGATAGLTADFYNRVCMPLFAGLLALLALCPWLAWQGGLRKKRQFFLVLVAFFLAAAGAYSMGYRIPVALSGMAGGFACLVSIGLLMAEKATRNNRGTLVAFGIHAGVVLIALGIAFSGPYKEESKPTLQVGESTKIGSFEVRFKNLYEGRGPGYIFLEGELEIKKDGKVVGLAAPQRRVYEKWGQMQFAEADTLPSLGDEFYASLLAVDREGKALFNLSVHPFVNWLWIGGTIMSLLPFLILRTRRRSDAENIGNDEK